MSHNADIILGLLLEAKSGLTARQLSKMSQIRLNSVLRALDSLGRYDLVQVTDEKDELGGYVWRAL